VQFKQSPQIDETEYKKLDEALLKFEKGALEDNLTSPVMQQIFRKSVQPYIISWLKYDPSEQISQLDQPVLILQGNTDIQVAVEEAEKLAKANPKAQKLIIEQMNHVLKKVDMERKANMATYTNESLPLHPEVLKYIIQFVNN
jgi:fermentation-respiration switch protein FrsA (DUF1100 family)